MVNKLIEALNAFTTEEMNKEVAELLNSVPTMLEGTDEFTKEIINMLVDSIVIKHDNYYLGLTELVFNFKTFVTKNATTVDFIINQDAKLKTSVEELLTSLGIA